MKIRVSNFEGQTPDSDFVLAGEQVHVWRLDLDGGLPAWELLDAAEIARARRFRFAQDQHRFAVRRTRVRQLLSRYLQQPAAGLPLQLGPQGKPALAGGAVQFNVSAAEGLALCAVTRHRPLGVDLERVRPFPWEAIAVDLFHPAELTHLRQVAAHAQQRHCFFQYWTAHEAIVKADGGGLSRSLAAVDCSGLVGKERAHLVDSTGTGWDCFSLVPRAGWVATLAVGR